MTDRTRDTALEALLANREECVGKIQDQELAALLSEQLVKEVFSEAWRLQYEDDTQPFQRSTKDLVEDVAESATS